MLRIFKISQFFRDALLASFISFHSFFLLNLVSFLEYSVWASTGSSGEEVKLSKHGIQHCQTFSPRQIYEFFWEIILFMFYSLVNICLWISSRRILKRDRHCIFLERWKTFLGCIFLNRIPTIFLDFLDASL